MCTIVTFLGAIEQSNAGENYFTGERVILIYLVGFKVYFSIDKSIAHTAFVFF